MKKILLIVMNVVLVLAFSACSGESEKMHKEIENIAENMMKCVQDKDVEGIYDFFDSDTKENREAEIKKQLQDLFEFIDGEIVSYGEYNEGGGRQSISHGKIYRYTCVPEYREVNTDGGKVYYVLFFYNFINDRNTEYVGLNSVRIIDSREPENYVDAGAGHFFGD